MSKSYYPSAPAMIAARSLWKNYVFYERSETKATERNVATLIDLFTQVFRVEEALNRLANRVQWLDHQQLREQMEEAREALRALQIARERMPKADGPTDIAAPAWAAAQALLKHFDIVPKPGAPMANYPVKYLERNIARGINYAIGVFRIEQLVDGPVDEVLRMNRDDLSKNMNRLRAAVQGVELQRNRLPHYGQPPKFTRPGPEIAPPELTQEQQRHLQLVKKELAAAKTPEELTAVLSKAGIG